MMRGFIRWLALVGLLLALPGHGEVVPDGGELPGQVRIAPLLELVPGDVPPGYSHVADLNVYLTYGPTPSLGRIRAALAYAQSRLDRCRIHLRLRSVNRVLAPPLLAEWESLEFNQGLTPWELALFSVTPPHSAGIVYVRQVDWTIGRDGVTAIGYGDFLTRRTEYLADGRERAFFHERMAGHAVLGSSVGADSLAHELGHALLGLEHVGDRNNLMFRGLLARARDARLTESQCATGRANTPWVQPIPGRTNVAAVN